MNTTTIRWVGLAIDCCDAGPVARFYDHLLGFEMGDFDPPAWAQLWDERVWLVRGAALRSG